MPYTVAATFELLRAGAGSRIAARANRTARRTRTLPDRRGGAIGLEAVEAGSRQDVAARTQLRRRAGALVAQRWARRQARRIHAAEPAELDAARVAAARRRDAGKHLACVVRAGGVEARTGRRRRTVGAIPVRARNLVDAEVLRRWLGTFTRDGRTRRQVGQDVLGLSGRDAADVQEAIVRGNRA